ncbi:MAG: hypothetical protein IJ270_06935 [Paludibacteraceae bacterium]|nr:hypothetical protein [Paludibacteraceae bacterium]
MKFLKKVTLASTLIIFCGNLFAQKNETMYFMDAIPNVVDMNPALQPRCNTYLELPIPTIFVSERNNLTQTENLANEDGKLFFEVTSPKDKEFFYNRVKNVTKANVEFSVDILNFGWRKERNYWNVGIGVKGNVGLAVPKALLDLGYYAKDNGTHKYDLSKMGLNASVYTEFGVGYSRKIGDHWTVGGKFKILNGIANLHLSSRNSYIQITDKGNDKYHINLGGDKVVFKASVPVVGLNQLDGGENDAIDANGDSIFDNVGDRISENIDEYHFNDEDYPTDYGRIASCLYKNFGAAIDLGFVYEPVEHLRISAAVNDLGFIHWSNDVAQLSLAQGESDFELKMDNPSAENVYECASEEGAIRVHYDNYDNANKFDAKKGYTTMVNAKFNAAIEYGFLDERISIGLLSSNTIFCNRIFTQLTPSINFRPVEFFSASLSYSLINTNYHSIGAGLNFHIYPLNLFIVSDIIPLKKSEWEGIINFSESDAFPNIQANIAIGLNMTWGCKYKNNEPSFIY